VLATQRPYAGGLYVLDYRYHELAIWRPPTVRFLTPVLHPRVAGDGRFPCEDAGVMHRMSKILMLLLGLLSEDEVTRWVPSKAAWSTHAPTQRRVCA
jgi:ubiquitin-protein ligase